MIKPYECTQCGATDFEDLSGRRLRCAYCGSLFQLMTREPVVSINKGAKVVFGRNANVEIRGDLDVQEGAQVDVQGRVTVLEGGRQHEFSLKLVREVNKRKE